MSTIHMSLWSIVRSFPFLEFEREVLHLLPEQRAADDVEEGWPAAHRRRGAAAKHVWVRTRRYRAIARPVATCSGPTTHERAAVAAQRAGGGPMAAAAGLLRR